VLVLRVVRLGRGGRRDVAEDAIYNRARASPGMQANPSTCGVLTSVGMSSVSGQRYTFGKTAGRATQPEWIYRDSQWFYFKLRAGGEVRTRILGFYNNKKTGRPRNKQTILKKTSHDC